MPYDAKNTMRRDCCPRGFLHLNCITDRDLEMCHACQKDPMKNWTDGFPRTCWHPFNRESLPVVSRSGVRDVRAAKRTLREFKRMAVEVIEEMTAGWTNRIRVGGVEISASFLDGTLKVDRDNIPRGPYRYNHVALRQMLTELIGQSLDRWAGPLFLGDISTYKLDEIVEITIRFSCFQWTMDVVSAWDERRPFKTKQKGRDLGRWNCFACLSGFANIWAGSKPQAKRFVTKEVKRGQGRIVGRPRVV